MKPNNDYVEDLDFANEVIDDCVVECAYLSLRVKKLIRKNSELIDLFNDLYKQIQFEEYQCKSDCDCDLCTILEKFKNLTREDEEYGI